MKILINLGSPAFRQYAYGLCSAVSVALAMVGILDDNKVAALNVVFTALFAVAAANASETPVTPEENASTYVGKHVLTEGAAEDADGEISVPSREVDNGQSV